MSRNLNLEIKRSADFVVSIPLIDDDTELPIDLSMHDGEAVMRPHWESQTNAAFTVACDSDGTITMTMTAVQTANLTSGDWVYDLKLTDTVSNTVSYPISGRIRVRESST